MRINYVLIDFENVQPESLSVLLQDQFKVMVFVGANQTKVPIEVALAMQAMGNKAEYVRIAGNGPNALDFHIAFYIGQLAAADPTAFFHIISKDTGFDPLIAHLKTKNIFVDRKMSLSDDQKTSVSDNQITSISDIPLVKTSTTMTPEERLQVFVDKLRLPKSAKPGTVKTLSSHINNQFQKQLSETEIAAIVSALSAAGYIAIANNKITYTL